MTNHQMVSLSIDFAIHVEGNYNIERVLMWATEKQLSKLKLLDHFYVDGSFDFVPRGFKQIAVIYGMDKTRGYHFPAAFFLLTSKSEFIYRKMFTSLRELIEGRHRNRPWSPQYITNDFKKSLSTAAKQVFDNPIIIGCLFQFKQALYRKATKKE